MKKRLMLYYLKNIKRTSTHVLLECGCYRLRLEVFVLLHEAFYKRQDTVLITLLTNYTKIGRRKLFSLALFYWHYFEKCMKDI